MYGMYPVYVRKSLDMGFDGFGSVGKFGFGVYEVYLGKKVVGIENVVYVRTNLLGKLFQYPYHFTAFLSFEFSYSVVGLHDLSRFDEYGFPSGRLIMYDTAYFPFQCRCHGYHETSVAKCRCNVFLNKAFALCRS